MRITRISSVRPVARNTKILAAFPTNIKDIKETLNLPKIEPASSIKPLRNPLDDDNGEQEEQVNQDGDRAIFRKQGIRKANSK